MNFQNTGRTKPRRETSFLVWFLLYFFLSIIFLTTVGLVALKGFSEGLPGLDELERIPEEQLLSSIVYSSDGVELRTFQREKRFWVKYDDIPQCMIDAITSAEDSRYFEHWGVSVPDIIRAFKVDVFHMGIKQGASTITQQLARTLFEGRDQTIKRKIREMLDAVKIERTYSKPEIMEMFLNKMEFSNNSFGIQAAARGYFGKNASEIGLSEAALLAGILQAPSYYNPRSGRRPLHEQLDIAQKRRNTILWMMANDGKISKTRAREEMEKPIELGNISDSDYGKAPYFVDNVRAELESKYGKDFVETSGAKVYTTLDYRLQTIAEQTLSSQLDTLQTVFKNKIKYERPPGISDYEAFYDSLTKTVVQGAIVAIDVRTGKILAMVGGRKYSRQNQFNRATQALRQAGSSFKPFVYTAALDNGWRCSDTIYDGYVSYNEPDGSLWVPKNFDNEYLGLVSLRDGFKKSQNVVSVKLMNDKANRGIGIDNVVRYAKKMGITTPIPPVKSLAVGTAPVKLIDIVSAYTVFPNLGIKTETFSVNSVFDKNNTLISSQSEGSKSDVLKPEVASLMVTMLRSVCVEGTAAGVLKLKGMNDRPCGGKTGTGQDFKDAWFVGFTPYIACGVWIGFDSEETTLRRPANTGAAAALPVWVDFVKTASEVLGYQKDDFKLSGNLTTAVLCKDTYMLATSNCPATYTEYFIKGTQPTKVCDKHGGGARRTNFDTRFRDGGGGEKKKRGM